MGDGSEHNPELISGVFSSGPKANLQDLPNNSQQQRLRPKAYEPERLPVTSKAASGLANSEFQASFSSFWRDHILTIFQERPYT